MEDELSLWSPQSGMKRERPGMALNMTTIMSLPDGPIPGRGEPIHSGRGSWIPVQTIHKEVWCRFLLIPAIQSGISWSFKDSFSRLYESIELELLPSTQGFFAFLEFAAQDFAGGHFGDSVDELNVVELFVAGQLAIGKGD